MKQILLHNWKIKLTCLLMASLVWYVIKHNVDPNGDRRARPTTSERGQK